LGTIDFSEDEIADGIVIEVARISGDTPPAFQGHKIAVFDKELLDSAEIVRIIGYALPREDVAKPGLLLFLRGPNDEGGIEPVCPYDTVMLAVAEAITPEAQSITWPPEFIVSDLQLLRGGQGRKDCLRLLGRAIDRKEVQLVLVSLPVNPRVALAESPFVFDGEYDRII
jgi:hypothetical protein